MSPFGLLGVFAQYLAAPIRRLSPAVRLAASLCAFICCATCAIYAVAHNESVFVAGDARFYLGIASGDYSQVMQPFASRQLGALVVAALAHGLHWTIERGFLLEGAVSLVVMLAVVYYLTLRTAAPRWLLFAIALVPFWRFLLQDLVLPDLWYSALLAVMLLMLANEHIVGAALMMFPLMLSRESTSLTLICFLGAAWGWMQWRDRMIAVTSAIAGSVVVSRLSARAQPNLEHLPESVYILAKIPWNLMHNILGITPWSNVNPELCRIPIWTMSIHLGPVRTIGVCGFSFAGWMEMSRAMLNDFGLLPLLLAFLWWRCRKVYTHNLLLRFALLYGSASLLLAPMLGTWFIRLIGYAWPAFFVALPLLFDTLDETSPKGSRALAAIGFFGMHLAIFFTANSWTWTTQVSIDIALWAIAYLLLRHWLSSCYQPLDEPRVC